MSKVNFVSEFNSFMRYARDNSLSLRERMLWIALFYVANDRKTYNDATQEYEWPDGFFQVSNGELNLYCCLDKRAIETLRNGLKQRGLIDFQPGLKNKRNPAYRLFYFSADIGNKNAPNNTPNNVPKDAPKHTPNNAPNHVPNPAPSHTENDGFLGANLPPTIPPYTQNKYANQFQNGYKGDSNGGSEQRTYRSSKNGGYNPQPADGGFVDLSAEGAGCEGFVPLPWEDGL